MEFKDPDTSQLQFQYHALAKSFSELTAKSRETEILLRTLENQTLRDASSHNQAIGEIRTKQVYQAAHLEELGKEVKALIRRIEAVRLEAAASVTALRANELKDLNTDLKSKASSQQLQTLENTEIDNLKRGMEELRAFQQKAIAMLSVITFVVPMALTILINWFKKG